MKASLNKPLAIILCSSSLLGCVGYDHALLMTKTNVGLDIDSKPPTAEVTIARREVAILPTFPEINTNAGETGTANTLPILASFGLQGNLFNPHITGHFAGGDAAVGLVSDQNQDSAVCIDKKPDTRSLLLKAWHALTDTSFAEYQQQLAAKPEGTKPFYFATDTSYGVKVAWSGTTGPYPDSLKLGYNRKEFAAPPIFVNSGCKSNPNGFNVKMPSFYANIDNSSGFESWGLATANHVQFFATGIAATQFAKKSSVRQAAFENMAPRAAEIEAAGLNKSLLAEIEAAYSKADSTKQQEILAAAVNLELVDAKSDSANFIDNLNKNEFVSNYLVSTKLNKLRVISIGR